MKRKYLILIPIIILFIISIIYLPTSLKIKQSIWVSLSLIICFIISKIKFKKILKYSMLMYILIIILLILVLVLNKFTNGSRGWITLGSISIQPSEFLKPVLILMSIKYLKINNFLYLLIYLIPCILIFLEPDTGGVIYCLILLLYFLNIKLKRKEKLIYSSIIISILILFIFVYLNNQDFLIKILGTTMFYRIDRITNFFSDNSIQTTNALISIANSKTLYFPEMFNDFFISYILSNNIMLIIPIILSTIILLIMIYKKNTTISKAVFYVFLWQVWWNIAMNLKLVPVIGIPYLFLSYGGSHILSSMIMIGLIISMGDNNKDYKNKAVAYILD